MRTDSIVLLTERDEIEEHVLGLWSPGGDIRRNHAEGGLVAEIVGRFAAMPRIFFEPSEPRLEWTHFSPWWGAIQIADYENRVIRDLRYLHEIYHAATMPHIRGMNLATMAERNAQNEREASTLSEIAIYLEIPELRAKSFPHPIFADRVLFRDGALREDMRERWRADRREVLQELLYARLQVVLASDDEVDAQDPQILWLRRYPEQGEIWNGVWSSRHRLVDDAMVSLRERSATIGRREAGRRHLDWLLSAAIADGSDVPFRREAVAFRETFDRLIEQYDRAMTAQDEKSVAHVDR